MLWKASMLRILANAPTWGIEKKTTNCVIIWNFDHFLDAIRKHVQNENFLNIDYRTSNEYSVQQYYFWQKFDQKKEYFVANTFLKKRKSQHYIMGKISSHFDTISSFGVIFYSFFL
jgi:hypothetical protein